MIILFIIIYIQLDFYFTNLHFLHICIFNSSFENHHYTALPWQKEPTDIIDFRDNGQKLCRAAIDLYKILDFEGV